MWRRCGNSECINSGLGPALYLWRTLCTNFSVRTGRVVEGGDELVLKDGVNHHALVVIVTLLFGFSEEALLLPGRRRCQNGCLSSQFGQTDEGGVKDVSILIGQKNETNAAVWTSDKVPLNRRRVIYQELMYLLDGSVVLLACMLGKLGGK